MKLVIENYSTADYDFYGAGCKNCPKLMANHFWKSFLYKKLGVVRILCCDHTPTPKSFFQYQATYAKQRIDEVEIAKCQIKFQ